MQINNAINFDTACTHPPNKISKGDSKDNTHMILQPKGSLDKRQESFATGRGESSKENENEDRESIPTTQGKVRFDPDVNIQTDSFSPKNSSPRKSKNLHSSLKNKGKGSPSRPSVFERLSNTETVASIHRKLVSHQIRRSTSAPPRLRRPLSATTSATKQKQNQNQNQNQNSGSGANKFDHDRHKKVGNEKTFKIITQMSFDRLAVSHTKLSKIRQRRPSARGKTSNGKHKSTRENSFRRGGFRRVRSTSRGRYPDTGLQQWKSSPNVVNANVVIRETRVDEKKNTLIQSQDEDDYSSIATESIPLEIEFNGRMQIFTTNTHKPEDGYQELDTSELELNGCLAEYEAGGLSVKAVSSEIVSTLLLRDLPGDANWHVGIPSHRDLALPLGEAGYSFHVEAQERESRDAKEPRATASATGSIIFIHDLSEIHIENYSFVVSNEI